MSSTRTQQKPQRFYFSKASLQTPPRRGGHCASCPSPSRLLTHHLARKRPETLSQSTSYGRRLGRVGWECNQLAIQHLVGAMQMRIWNPVKLDSCFRRTPFGRPTVGWDSATTASHSLSSKRRISAREADQEIRSMPGLLRAGSGTMDASSPAQTLPGCPGSISSQGAR